MQSHLLAILENKKTLSPFRQMLSNVYTEIWILRVTETPSHFSEEAAQKKRPDGTQRWLLLSSS